MEPREEKPGRLIYPYVVSPLENEVSKDEQKGKARSKPYKFERTRPSRRGFVLSRMPVA